MASKRDYTKDIIEEYNIRLQSWGNSDSWGLTEFKMLEDLIYESSKMRINANTLKRFFQQRTSNPQMATYNALCIFLGYSGYAEFIMKKTQQEKTQAKNTEKPADTNDVFVYPKPNNIEKQKENYLSGGYKKIIYPAIILVGIILLLVVIYWDTFKEKRENYLISEIVFQSSLAKGTSPFTVKVNYDIPEGLMDSISFDYVEANGDIATRQINTKKGELYATFIYPGRGLCQLKYKNDIIRTIEIESRTPGWSAYLKEDRTNFYMAIPFTSVNKENGYLTLPAKEIPPKADTDKLFVSYTYYTDSIIDGDNFIFEAKVRNSKELDNGIHCYDIMMYIFSNTAFHGFALNENCYSYLKFISSENTITGNQQDLSHINFDPSVWHVMKIEVIDKKTTFYLDNEVVLQMDYKVSLGTANELTLRFKGCGAVDYVKVTDPKTNKVALWEDFES